MMWFLLLLLHTAHIEPVVPQVDKLILRKTKGNPCEGHLEVHHRNTWGYVGDAGWNARTEAVVCKSTHCGEPVEHLTTSVLMSPKNSLIWLNELKCDGRERALWDCDGPGWNASIYQGLTVKKVTCSRNIKINLDKSNCSGAIQFQYDKISGYFCNDSWVQKGARLVCKSLGCGEVRTISPLHLMDNKKFSNSKRMKLDCSAFGNQDPDNLWQCVTGEYGGDPSTCKPAAVTCEGYQRLQIKGSQSNVCSGDLEEERNGKWEPTTQVFPFDVCEQMHCGTTRNKTNNSPHVTCTDKVKVVLGDSEGSCYGAVNIKLNSSVLPVCGSSWGKQEAELVCKELNCGKLIYFTQENMKRKGAMNYVKCSGSESSLWHCEAAHGEHVQCSSQPKVVCADSVKVELVDGPGKCAGRLAIKLGSDWRRVASTSWKDSQSAIVCKQLNCGQMGKTEKFVQGSGKFLSIDCADKNVSDISECLTDKSFDKEDQAVGITCDEHKVVLLNGSETCSGYVQIQNSSETCWLSGSNATWNNESAQTVCQQMHCGSVVSFSSEQAGTKTVWDKSHNCSSTEKSLFDCKEITPLPPGHADLIAKVTCSGKIEMNLANGCWGEVTVYTDKVQGHMCADTWTEEMSEKLCTYLNCGTAIKANNIPKNGAIQFNSLHKRTEQDKLTQWNLVRSQTNGESCNRRPAYVVCSGSVKPRFSTSREHCSGNLEMESEGQWIPVCSEALQDKNTRNAICQQLKCGDAIKSLPYFGPTPAAKHAVLNLTANANNLTDCRIGASLAPASCNYSGLRCAEWKAMFLIDKKPCSGTVFVHSEKERHAVSQTGWTETERKKLCRHIDCGDQPTNKQTPDQKIEINSYLNNTFNCTKVLHNSTNIWDCEEKTSPAVKTALFIECKGEPKVTFSHVEVRINGIPVCSSNWNLSYAHKVCQEKGWGNAVHWSTTQSQPQGEAYYVSCEDYHSVLGQCKRIKGKCRDVVSVFCSNNVTFRATEKTKGEVEVNYRNKWEKICLNNQDLKESLCNEAVKNANSKENSEGKLETMLDCSRTDTALDVKDTALDVKDIKRCVKQQLCGSRKPVICNNLPPSQPTPPPPSPPSLASIIVGVALLLLVVILIVLFIRFYVRRTRKSRVASRMLSTQDMEYESGEYEDVMNKENELEDFSPGRFRSEDNFITENDRKSVSSLPYDDIDEADEARSLASPGAAAPANRDGNTHEDGVTYEVEDPQESYDDIDTIHETTQTKAEVHDSPQTTRDTAAPPGLAQRDEDYLEPDQDG